MSRRGDILTAIESALSQVTRANGYLTDIGADCQYWREFPVDYEGLDACTFFDEDEEAERVNQCHEWRLTIELQAISYITENAKVESSNALSDLIRVIRENRRWGGLAINTELEKNEKEIDTKGRRATRATLVIEVLYRTGLYDYD